MKLFFLNIYVLISLMIVIGHKVLEKLNFAFQNIYKRYRSLIELDFNTFFFYRFWIKYIHIWIKAMPCMTYVTNRFFWINLHVNLILINLFNNYIGYNYNRFNPYLIHLNFGFELIDQLSHKH